jgi:signal transduction histidine kinase
MNNADKHAGPSQVIVRLWDQPEGLSFTICDTGHGFDPRQPTPGTGITNMRDRIAAVGGNLTIASTPHGTVVNGSVPWPQ